MPPALTDAHNHLQDPRLANDLATIVEDMRRAGIASCVVNGTCQQDWPVVARLAGSYPGFIRPAFGLHPWKINERTGTWLDDLKSYLDRFPSASLGECGLDGCDKRPDLAAQTDIFLAHLELAAERDLPVSVHCVKAFGPLVDVLARAPRPPRGFLLHSYGGSTEFMRRMLPLGAWFSCSGYFLHPRKTSHLETFRLVPPDRFLLESDAPDIAPPDAFLTHPLPCASPPLNHPANLPAIAAGIANAFGEPPESLISRTTANFHRFFGQV